MSATGASHVLGGSDHAGVSCLRASSDVFSGRGGLWPNSKAGVGLHPGTLVTDPIHIVGIGGAV